MSLLGMITCAQHPPPNSINLYTVIGHTWNFHCLILTSFEQNLSVLNIELRVKEKKNAENYFLKIQNADEKFMRTHELGVGNIFHRSLFNVLSEL